MKKIWLAILICLMTVACGQPKREVVLYSEIHSTDRMREMELEVIKEFYNKGGRLLLLERGFCRGELFNHWADTGNEQSLRLALSPTNTEYEELDNDIKFYKKILEICPDLRFYGVDIEHQYIDFEDYFMDNVYSKLNEDKKAKADKSIEQINKINNADFSDLYYNKSDHDDYVDLDAYREEMMAENALEIINNTSEEIIGFFGRAHLAKLENYDSMITMIQDKLPWVKDVDLVGQMEINPGDEEKLRVYGRDVYASLMTTDNSLTQGYGRVSSRETFVVKNSEDFKDCKVISEPMPYYIAFKINPNEYYLVKYNIFGGSYYYKMFRVSDKHFDGSGNPMIEELEI